MHLREGGEGSPTTLLLHGWAVPGAVWDPVLARWPADAGRVLVPDLRGTGFSSKPRDGYALEDDVNDVLALIDELGLKDILLVGHSKGGAIAQRVAVERPGIVRKLVLVCPVPASGVPLDDPTLGYFRSLCGPRDGLQQLIVMTTASAPDPTRLNALVDAMASVALESLHGGLDAFRTANFAEQIGKITAPTLVIGGGGDPVLVPAMLQELVADKIPGAKFQVMDGIGHYPQIEAPDQLTRLLVEAATSLKTSLKTASAASATSATSAS